MHSPDILALPAVHIIDDSFDEQTDEQEEPEVEAPLPVEKEEEVKPITVESDGEEKLNVLSDPNALHCICKTKYNAKKFYLCCDTCSHWFHGSCVGINERQAAKLEVRAASHT